MKQTLENTVLNPYTYFFIDVIVIVSPFEFFAKKYL